MDQLHVQMELNVLWSTTRGCVTVCQVGRAILDKDIGKFHHVLIQIKGGFIMFPVKKLPKFKMFQIFLQLQISVAYKVKIFENNFCSDSSDQKG